MPSLSLSILTCSRYCHSLTAATPAIMRPVKKVSPLRESAPMGRKNSDLALDELIGSTSSLVFDMEGMEQLTLSDPESAAKEIAGACETLEQLSWLLEPSSDAEKLLKLHIKVARECNPNNQVDPETLKRALERAGYTAKLHALAGKKLHGLRHEFLTVCLPDGGDSGSSTYVVDPNFRDSFVVAHPTPRYSAVLAGVDQEVVATQACLRRAVTILSRELARSFTEQGVPVPPWRTQQALLSKWQLQHSPGGCGQPLFKAWGLEAGAPGSLAPVSFGRVS